MPAFSVIYLIILFFTLFILKPHTIYFFSHLFVMI
nr:MAG TPA: hypothetical protein [Caudoviricetes sp.]